MSWCGLFYRIVKRADGLVDVWMTPGEAVPAYYNLSGRVDFNIRLQAVCGVNPEDPQWGGDLEANIRAHYGDWMASAEEVEI